MQPIQMTAPQIAHKRWTRLKCATLSHCPLRHAQALPFAPSTKGMIKMPMNGTSVRSAMKVLFPIPHIQLSRNAPSSSGRFQRGYPCIWDECLDRSLSKSSRLGIVRLMMGT